MSKEQFTRERVHDTNMKTVIMRLDYSGVADNLELVKLFDKQYPKAFKGRTEHHNREFNIKLRKEDILTISKTLSLPVSVIERETIMRYSGLRQVQCDVTLDVSQYYLCMTLICNDNYDGIDNYIEIFKGAISVFKDKTPYFQPRRLGLRKVRVESKPTLKECLTPFEPDLFREHSFGFNNDISIVKTDILECFELVDFNSLKFNVRRTLESGKDADGKFQVASTLDIDAYHTEESLANVNINQLLSTANTKMFEVYKSCVTEEYLSSICR